jgi:hypothetical protein
LRGPLQRKKKVQMLNCTEGALDPTMDFSKRREWI